MREAPHRAHQRDDSDSKPRDLLGTIHSLPPLSFETPSVGTAPMNDTRVARRSVSSFHVEDTSDKPDLALLKTAPRVRGLLREIVDVHP